MTRDPRKNPKAGDITLSDCGAELRITRVKEGVVYYTSSKARDKGILIILLEDWVRLSSKHDTVVHVED